MHTCKGLLILPPTLKPFLSVSPRQLLTTKENLRGNNNYHLVAQE